MASAELRLLCLNFFCRAGPRRRSEQSDCGRQLEYASGRPDFAQAGGNAPAKLDAALREVPEWVRQRLA